MSSPAPARRYGLGRIPSPFDLRDHLYSMKTELARRGTVLIPASPAASLWAVGPVLDQGETPDCTGFAWRDHLDADPFPETGGPDGFTIYADEKQIDGMPNVDGSWVRCGAQILKGFGLIQQYAWAYDEATIRAWVLTQSPVVLGTNWYDSMDFPGADGRVSIEPNATIVGGHAYLVAGYDSATDLYTCQNS